MSIYWRQKFNFQNNVSFQKWLVQRVAELLGGEQNSKFGNFARYKHILKEKKNTQLKHFFAILQEI